MGVPIDNKASENRISGNYFHEADPSTGIYLTGELSMTIINNTFTESKLKWWQFWARIQRWWREREIRRYLAKRNNRESKGGKR
jgi:hypothetical protein